MKNWCRANIPDWEKYQPDLQKFILRSVANTEEIYNYVGIEEFNQNCNEVIKLVESHFDSRIEKVIVLKMTQSSMNNLGNRLIHVDSGPRLVRLNCPILNPDTIITKYFKVVDPTYVPRRKFFNAPFKDYVDIYDPNVCQEVDNVCVDQPTIFSVTAAPHGMFVAGDQWPRIICSFNFVDDTNLIKYLEDSAENL